MLCGTIAKGQLSPTGDQMNSEARVLRVFFFSSRRRHTRFDCDWSSDVCSSDLFQVQSELSDGVMVGQLPTGTDKPEQFGIVLDKDSPLTACVSKAVDQLGSDKIGRASCRERV